MNYSMLNSTSPQLNLLYDRRSHVQIVIQASSLGAFIFSTIFGNILILLAVYTNHQLQDITSVFIVNLACADLLLALIGMPFTLVSSVAFDWIFGDALCKFHGFINFIFAIASVLSLASIAVERYVAIMKPLKYHTIMTHQTVLGMLACIWCYSLSGALLPVTGWSRYSYIQMEAMCTVDWPYSVSNTIYTIVSYFFFPLAIITYCYFHILNVAKEHSKRINPMSTFGEFTKSSEQVCNIAVEIQTQGEAIQGKRQKAEKKYKQDAKAAKTLLLVIGTFLFCWAPHMVGVISLLVPESNWPSEFFVVTTWLAMMNSACNPIIYGVLNRRFRESFKKILRCGRTLPQLPLQQNPSIINRLT